MQGQLSARPVAPRRAAIADKYLDISVAHYEQEHERPESFGHTFPLSHGAHTATIDTVVNTQNYLGICQHTLW